MDINAPVIIAGGGPVGMCLAIDLALRGIATVLVEPRRGGDFLQAKANMTNIRSMEFFRRWGMADALRANDHVGPEVQRDVSIVTRLNGHLVHHWPKTYESRDALAFAAELGEWAPNECIEKTLYDRANELPLIDRRYESEVTDFTQDAEGVTVSVSGPQGSYELKGLYLAIADGARSRLRREVLNVRMEGKPNLAVAFSWNFRAPDLPRLWKAGPMVSMVYFYNEDRGADVLLPQEGTHRFTYFCAPVPAGVDGDNWDDVKAMLFRAVGEEFDAEPISGRQFRMHSLMAPRFDYGRALLLGDAAHQVSPQGGFGMNLGVLGAADLGWKLQAMIEGWGGPFLLPSYTTERREAVQFCQRGAEQNQAAGAPELVRDGIELDGPEGDAVREAVSQDIVIAKTQQFKSMGGQLGYSYTLSNIIYRDAGRPVQPDFRNYTPSAMPGNRAPHHWLGDGTSLYDHFGHGFTLLVLGDFDSSVLLAQAKARGIPVAVLQPAGEDREKLLALYKCTGTLIRSDHIICWHGDALPDVARLLDVITGNLTYAPATATVAPSPVTQGA